jgi:hypothetical protein
MAASPRVRIIGVAHLHGAIRIAKDPVPKGDERTDRRFRVGVHPVCEVAVLLVAVLRQRLVPVLA